MASGTFPTANLPAPATQPPPGLLAGACSWFGGPDDPSSGSTTASGASVAVPGIAVYNKATLAGWWMVQLPNGTVAVIRQTDLGPAPSTGRKFDFTYSALPALGYSEQTFPTGQQVEGVYLGTQTSTWIPASEAEQLLGLTAAQRGAISTNTDVGYLAAGGAVAVDPSGNLVPLSSSERPLGSDAQAVNTPVTGGANAVSSAVSSIGGLSGLLGNLTSGAFWFVVLKILGGLVLLLLGAYLLLKGK